jgi:hypothetical protein
VLLFMYVCGYSIFMCVGTAGHPYFFGGLAMDTNFHLVDWRKEMLKLR